MIIEALMGSRIVLLVTSEWYHEEVRETAEVFGRNMNCLGTVKSQFRFKQCTRNLKEVLDCKKKKDK